MSFRELLEALTQWRYWQGGIVQDLSGRRRIFDRSAEQYQPLVRMTTAEREKAAALGVDMPADTFRRPRPGEKVPARAQRDAKAGKGARWRPQSDLDKWTGKLRTALQEAAQRMPSAARADALVLMRAARALRKWAPADETTLGFGHQAVLDALAAVEDLLELVDAQRPPRQATKIERAKKAQLARLAAAYPGSLAPADLAGSRDKAARTGLVARLDEGDKAATKRTVQRARAELRADGKIEKRGGLWRLTDAEAASLPQSPLLR
jgi:hypothetical protein